MQTTKKPVKAIIGVEKVILTALNKRAGFAVTVKELKAITGVTGCSFKDAVIRLTHKGLVLHWRLSARVNLILAAKYAHSAYYLEQVKVSPLYLAFGHSTDTITIQRSIPFISLTDDGVRRKNRYREMDEEVA